MTRPDMPARQVFVPAERVAGWLQRFGGRHGEMAAVTDAEGISVEAADGSRAVLSVPFPPFVPDEGEFFGFVDTVLRPRRVGVLLVRKGGYAAGVFDGIDLVESKVGSRLVQSRSAAGGTSQQRFARRRDNQARAAYQAAADCAVRVLVPHAKTLAAVVLGGDRSALDATLTDPRLALVRPLVAGRLLTVPDPRLRVLQATPEQFRSVSVLISDPPEA